MHNESIYVTHVTYDPTWKGSPRWLGYAMEGEMQVHIELFREHIRFLNDHLNLNIASKPGQIYNVNRDVILWQQDMHMPRLFGVYDENGDFVSVKDSPEPDATPATSTPDALTTANMDDAVFSDSNVPEIAARGDNGQVSTNTDQLRQTKLFSTEHTNLSAFGIEDES